MKFIEQSLKGMYVIEPQIFEDDRGFFLESYSKRLFEQNGISADFVQDNHSKSSKGVLRGLHFQIPPFDQAKFVKVITGEVLDIAVDIRVGSPTYGKWEGVILTEQNKKMVFIPSGFAHGFAVLSDTADFVYKVTNYYSKEHDRGLLWNDPQININWQTESPILSQKDQAHPALKDLQEYFTF